MISTIALHVYAIIGLDVCSVTHRLGITNTYNHSSLNVLLPHQRNLLPLNFGVLKAVGLFVILEAFRHI